MTDVSSLTINAGKALAAVGVIIAGCWTFLSWAEGKHEIIEAGNKVTKAEIATQKETLTRLEGSNKLLETLVKQQAQLIEKTTENAQLNRETLIRIEAKLEQP